MTIFVPFEERTLAQLGTFNDSINTIGAVTSVRQNYLDTVVCRMSDSAHDTFAPNLSDRVTNGQFTTNTTGWTADASALAVVGAALRITNSGAAEGFARGASMAVTAGRTYSLRFDVPVEGTSGALHVEVGTVAGSNSQAEETFTIPASRGTMEVLFTANDSTSFVTFGTGSAVAGETTIVDNVRVNLVPTAEDLDTIALFTSTGFGQPWTIYAGGNKVSQWANNAVDNLTDDVTNLYPNYAYTDATNESVMTQRPA